METLDKQPQLRHLGEQPDDAAEYRYRQLLQTLPAAVYTCDLEGRITFYNEAAAVLWGRRPRLGRDLWCGSWKIYRRDGTEIPLEDCPMAIAIRERRSVRAEEIIIERPDTSRSIVLAHLDPIQDRSGAIIGMVNMLVDVGQRKRAEQALRRSEERLRSLLMLMPAAVYACDRDGNVTFYNRRAAELWGYEPEIGSAAPRLGGNFRLCHPDGTLMANDETPMALAIRNGTSTRNGDVVIERCDGSRVWASVSVDPLYDERGERDGAINVFQDISPLKRVEAELRDREEHLSAIIANTPDCVNLVGADGTLLEINPQGLDVVEADSPEQVIGRSFYDLIAPEYRDAFRALNERVCSGSKEGLQFQIVGLKGTRRWLATRAAPIVDRHTGRWLHLGVTRDITEQKSAQQALQASEEHLRGLMSIMPAAVYACDGQGRITFYNRRAAELWGREPRLNNDGEIFCAASKCWINGEVIPPDKTPMAIAAREGKAFRDLEPVFERPDGSKVNVLVNIDPLFDAEGNPCGAINVFQDISERKKMEEALRQRTRSLEVINEIGKILAGELDLDKLVQAVTDAGREVSGAEFGAFFYNARNEKDDTYTLYSLSGVSREAFCRFPMPRNTPLFDPTFKGHGVTRIGDVLSDPRYGRNPPYCGMPPGHLPVRSYLAVPVVSRSGEVLGGLFYGHSQPDIFGEESEKIVAAIAAQAAIAIDNARLFAAAQKEIRERKAGEEAKARLAAIVESSDDAIISKDLSGIITSWNEGARRLFGYTAEEAIGRPVGMLIPPELRDEAADILERIHRGERIDHYETVRCRKDGTRLDISLTVSPIVDADGRVTGASKIARNITERKRAEHRLRESEARFRLMADSFPVMIWMTDPEGKAVFLNRAYLEYFGLAEDRLAALDWTQWIHPEDRAGYVEAFQHALRERKAFQQRVRMRRFDGKWRWFESRGNPIFDAAGRMISYIGSSPDITDMYESQQALKELSQRKDEFLANMSHEIRSPLTGIMGYADVLLGKLKDPEDIACLRTIKESGDYLIGIVNDILDLSKIEAGKLILYVEPVSVHAVLAEIQALMGERARQKGLPLVLRYDGVLPKTLQTDRTRLRQILVNLVSNAIKFTDQGKVEIVARFTEPMLDLEVIDSGIGIAPEHQKILFQPFTQADTTSTRQYGGTGLGLAITKRLVEMLGGTISFESEPGVGSAFRVKIPAPTASAKVKDASPLDGHGMPGEDKPLRDYRVLVVDDRKEICYLVSRYITDAGGRADEAGDGETAIQAVEAAAKDHPFDAMILDIHMPGMDGYEVARTLRARGYKTPIIALTAGAMVGDREKCLQAGCDDYLTKPIDRRKLVQLIAQHAPRPQPESGAAGAKLRVLVVDDSYNACKLLSIFFERRGHEVRAAHDGASAVALAREFRPELILLDIRLPDMTGYELLRRLKELADINGARFIGVSGYYDELSQPTPGFDHFLKKPLDMLLLDQIVRSLAA